MVVIRTSRRRAAWLFLGSLLFVAVPLGLAWEPLRGFFVGRAIVGVVGLVGALFFGFCGGVLLRRLVRGHVAVVLDRRGIVDNSSAIPAGRIAWEEIVRIGVTTLSGQRFVGIDVKDREALYQRCRAQALVRMNVGFVGYPINIPETTIDRPAAELCDLLERHWRNPDLCRRLGEWNPTDERSS